LGRARRTGHVDVGLLSIATLAVPLASYYGSVAVHGNGFVSAFVSGTAFAASLAVADAAQPRSSDDEVVLELTTRVSTALGYAVWTLFGAIGVAHLASWSTWWGAVYALLALTVLRMAPVALALVGSGLRRPTVLFIAWFGPRGLASVVFGLIAVEDLPLSPQLEAVIGAVTWTVLLSVVLHGVTADPGARAYGSWVGRARPVEELRASVEPSAGRGRLHRDVRSRSG
jgi:NhaP-type Na+/H+ or K+/H+ antiporter